MPRRPAKTPAKTPRVYLCSNTRERHAVEHLPERDDATGQRCPVFVHGHRCPGVLRQVAGPGMRRKATEGAV